MLNWMITSFFAVNILEFVKVQFSLVGLSPGAQGALYPRDYPGSLGPYGGRSMFGDVPPTPGSGSVTLPGSVESKSYCCKKNTHTHTHACTLDRKITSGNKNICVFPISALKRKYCKIPKYSDT